MTNDTSGERPVFTARSVDDLLALAPVLLSFEPSDSVVMLTFQAEHAFHARVDLPGRDQPVAEAVESLLEPARRHGVGRVVFLLYTDDHVAAARLWRGLGRACDRHGIAVVEAIRCDGARWYPLIGGGRRLRTVGVPYDVSAHPFRAWAVVEGRVTHRSRAELEASLDSDPEAVAAVLPLVEEVEDPVSLRAEGTWAERLVARHTGAGTSPSDPEVARLVRAVADTTVRDAAWSPLTRATAEAHVRFWTDVLRRTPPDLVPPVATLLGFAAWQAGHGALAWCAVDRCSAVDPDYRLMTYLATALTQALPPDAWDCDVRWDEGLPA